MSSIFNQFVVHKTKQNREHGPLYIPFQFSPKLTSIIDGIKRAQYYAIAGRDSSGKRSFTDLNFLLTPFFWWMNNRDKGAKLKILYFNMGKPIEIKLQKWLCTYFWIYHQRLMDIATLNGTNSRLFDIDQKDEEIIQSSESFFNFLLEDSKVLEIFDGSLHPTGITNKIHEYMRSIGGVEKKQYSSEYIYEEEYKNQITIIIIDNVKRMKNESHNGNFYDENELHKKLNEYLIELRDFYKITPVVIIPSFNIPGINRPNQMTADIREFKHYFNDSNVAIHLTNPHRLQIDKYEGYKVKDFVAEDGIPRFRAVTILNNSEGRDNVIIPQWMFPENGMLFDLPRVDEEIPLTQVIEYIQNFKEEQKKLRTIS